MITRITTVALCCVLLAACQMVVVPLEPADVAHLLDEPVALAPGQTTTVVDSRFDTTIELTFVEVRSDTRCPNSTTSDVMCAWSGAVEVEMTAVVNDQSETFGLTGVTDYDGAVEGSIVAETDSTIWYFAGYDIVLVQVTPYPGDERPQPEDYVTTVIVRRVTELVPTPTTAPVSIEHLLDDTGMPVLCISEKAMVEWTAGVLEGEPYRFTPPIGDVSISNRQAADEVCGVLFGDGWRIGSTDDVAGIWAQVIETDAQFLIWDEDSETVVER